MFVQFTLNQYKGIQPNVVTYNTLVAMSPDYETAKTWLETMRKEGIQPNVFSYSALFSKDLSGESADDLLEWYLAQEYHPEGPIEAAIAGFRRIGSTDDALRLVLDYPHLPAALKIIREYPGPAIQYLQNIFNGDPRHANAAYALGITFFELNRPEEAEPYLEKALNVSTATARKATVEKMLQQIGDGKCGR